MRKGKRLPLDALAPYLLELPDPPQPLDLNSVFGNSRPVELEVGFGKGAYLVHAAQERPTTNFVGVEADRALQLFVAARLAKRQLVNVRLVKADARLFIHYVPPASLSAVHVYFPDPWWKQRHRKRRVFTAAFAQECARVLQPGGRLFIATDVEEYFGVMTSLIEQTPPFRLVQNSSGQSPCVPGSPSTNFERKALERGGKVWRALYECCGGTFSTCR